MLRDSLERLYQKVTFLQALLVLLMIVIAVVIDGQVAAISALSGGVAVLTSSFVYAALASESEVSAISAGNVLRRHIVAEVAKVVVVLMLLLCALASGWFVAGWLVVTMVVALSGHWLAVFIIR